MTTQEQIQFITDECIKANPSIKDLVFGCKAIWRDREDGKEYRYTFFEQTKSGAYSFCIIGQADTFTTDLHIIDGEIVSDGWEIIGREIRLADVLLAIGKVHGYEFDSDVYHDSVFTLVSPKHEEEQAWNLLKDSLTDQSPETIEFISNLLK